jgi:hypothetical protein
MPHLFINALSGAVIGSRETPWLDLQIDFPEQWELRCRFLLKFVVYTTLYVVYRELYAILPKLFIFIGKKLLTK